MVWSHVVWHITLRFMSWHHMICVGMCTCKVGCSPLLTCDPLPRGYLLPCGKSAGQIRGVGIRKVAREAGCSSLGPEGWRPYPWWSSPSSLAASSRCARKWRLRRSPQLLSESVPCVVCCPICAVTMPCMLPVLRCSLAVIDNPSYVYFYSGCSMFHAEACFTNILYTVNAYLRCSVIRCIHVPCSTCRCLFWHLKVTSGQLWGKFDAELWKQTTAHSMAVWTQSMRELLENGALDVFPRLVSDMFWTMKSSCAKTVFICHVYMYVLMTMRSLGNTLLSMLCC